MQFGINDFAADSWSSIKHKFRLPDAQQNPRIKLAHGLFDSRTHNFSMTINCEGWWDQSGLGRQPMNELKIAFDSRELKGSGVDIIGPFTLGGIIKSDGSVTIHKRYIGQHDVAYLGQFDGEGTFAGQWCIGEDSGDWSIRIVSGQSKPIQEIRPNS